MKVARPPAKASTPVPIIHYPLSTIHYPLSTKTMPFPLKPILTNFILHTTHRPLLEIATQWAQQTPPLPKLEPSTGTTDRRRLGVSSSKIDQAKQDERLLAAQREGFQRLAHLTQHQSLSPNEFTRLIDEFHTQESALYRHILCELKAQEFNLKLKEIESQWDALEKNWPSRLSRTATEELLVKGRDQYPLLLLVAPPNISKNCPDSIIYNLPQEIRNHLKLFLNTHYSENSLYPVECYSDYFNRDIFDIDIKQLRTVLAPIPTAVIYCDITDREVFFNIGVWGWQNDSFAKITAVPWNWREERKGLESQGYDSDESLYQIRQQLVKTYQLLATCFTDWYYLNLDRNYEPRLLHLQEEFPQAWLTQPLQLLQDAYHLNQSQIGYEDGERLLDLDSPQAAEQRFHHAVKSRPDFTQAAFKRGLAWYEAGRYTDAADCLATLVEKQTDFADAWFYRGMALTGLGQPQQAVTCFEKVTQLKPESYRSWQEWANTLASVGQHAMAQLATVKANQKYVSSLTEVATLRGHTSAILAVAFSPDNLWLASGSGDKTIKLWSVTRGREIRTLTGHTDFITSVTFSPDGEWLVSGSDDGTVKIWSFKTGEVRHTLRGHTDWVLGIAISPDGQQIASTSWDGSIKLWSFATDQEQLTLSPPSQVVTSIAFSPDGHWLAGGSQDHTIKLWSVASGEEQFLLPGHTDWVTSVIFSPDGQWLASASKDHTLKLWSVATGTVRHTFYGHTDSVWYVAFSPNSLWLVSGSWDYTLKIWSVATGVEERTLKGPSNSVLCTAFSPDGHWLACGGEDKMIKLWRTS